MCPSVHHCAGHRRVGRRRTVRPVRTAVVARWPPAGFMGLHRSGACPNPPSRFSRNRTNSASGLVISNLGRRLKDAPLHAADSCCRCDESCHLLPARERAVIATRSPVCGILCASATIAKQGGSAQNHDMRRLATVQPRDGGGCGASVFPWWVVPLHCLASTYFSLLLLARSGLEVRQRGRNLNRRAPICHQPQFPNRRSMYR